MPTHLERRNLNAVYEALTRLIEKADAAAAVASLAAEAATKAKEKADEEAQKALNKAGNLRQCISLLEIACGDERPPTTGNQESSSSFVMPMTPRS